jgi:hypothetical protein
MNQQDTQFQNFAKLLVGELLKTDDVWADVCDEEWRNKLELLIARRAYDLACHIVQVQAQGTDLCFAADPRWIQGRVELTSDMTELPKEQE